MSACASSLHCHHLAGRVLVPDVTALLALKIVSNGGWACRWGNVFIGVLLERLF